jgi:predicted HTH transcriptional regulator
MTSAETMLGLNDSGEDFGVHYSEQEVADMFADFGVGREGFQVVRSKSYNKSDDDLKFLFAAADDLSEMEKKIVDLIKKDRRITNKLISEALRQPLDLISNLVNGLQTKKIISKRNILGIRSILKPVSKPVGPELVYDV